MPSSKIIPFPVPAPRLEPAAMAVAAPAPRQSVTFSSPFRLPGMDVPHRPGTFELRETRKALDVSWDAYQISLSIMLVDGGTTEAFDVSATDLQLALDRDRAVNS